MADAPSTPGSYVGQSQNGYFWNGTSWDQGETTPSSAVPPSTMSLNSGAPTVVPSPAPTTPAPTTPTPTPTPPASPSTPAPAPSTSSSKRPSILSTIMRIESGGKNVPQSLETKDINNNYGQGGGDPAQGFYQITGGTWREFGGDKAGHKSAIDAPYATQLQIAQNIPVARWGPATQQALKAAGYEPKPGETLGQMLARYNEDPTATRPEDVGGSSGGGTATATAQGAPFVPPSFASPSGLLAAQQTAAGAAADKEQANKNQALIKQGQGLLAQTETPGAAFLPAPPGHRPQAQMQPFVIPGAQQTPPDFMQILAQQRLMQGT